jgi:hypothetical protein
MTAFMSMLQTVKEKDLRMLMISAKMTVLTLIDNKHKFFTK